MSFLQGRFGSPNVEKLTAKRDITGLIKALNYKTLTVRKAAAEALGKIGDAQAVTPLINVLSDESVRQAAVIALGEIGDKQALKPLIAVLEDDESTVRQAAAFALSKLDSKRVIKPLIAILGDREPTVRLVAARALKKLGWEPDDKSRAAAEYWIANWEKKFDSNGRLVSIEQCIQIGPPAVEPLNAALQHWDVWVREGAVKTLGDISDSHAVESLTGALLIDPEPEVRQSAAVALGKIRDTRAVASLVIALGDKNCKVRLAVAKALDALNWKPGQDEIGARYWVAKREWKQCVQIGLPAMKALNAASKVEYWEGYGPVESGYEPMHGPRSALKQITG